MKSLWNIPGLAPSLQKSYAQLCEARRLVEVGSKKLIVYSGDINGMHEDLARLIELGLAGKTRVGTRTLIVLGTWETIERRFAGGGANVSTVFTSDMSELLARYSEQQQKIIERVFAAFGSIRKSNKVAPSVCLRQLQAYEQHPVSAVIDGLRAYLEGGYAERGIGEPYALGIIRGCAKEARFTKSTQEEATKPRSTVQEDDVIRKRRQMKREERVKVDERVQQLIVEQYGIDASLERLSATVVSGFVSKARLELLSGSG